MIKTRKQSPEEAMQIETGGMKNTWGKPYTKENYPYIFKNKPYHPTVSVMKWKSTKNGYKWQEYDHEETDYTRYEADDGKYISVGNCRCCKENIKPYKETFYLKEFEYNTWNNTTLNADNGYCRQCAIKKAVVINHGWKDYLAIKSESKRFTEDQELLIREYEDGSVIEEMTTREASKVITE